MYTRLRHIALLIVGLGLVLPLALAQDKAQNIGNFRMHPDAQMGVYGDLKNNGVMNQNAGIVLFKGRAMQTISGRLEPQFERVYLNNASNLTLETPVSISEKFIFQVGLVYTPRNTPSVSLHFLDNARHDSTSNSRHVNGYVAKSGKDSFYFPIGDGRRWCPAAISTPSVPSDFFAAYYNYDPSSTLLPVGAPFSRTSHALDVPKISDKEYWHIEGKTNVRITLAWDDKSNVATLTDNDLQRLIVTGWDGQKWVNLGAVSITGSLETGRITSRMVQPDSFRIFTLALGASATRCVAAVLDLGNDLTTCANQSITLHASNDYRTYTWSNGSTDSTLTVNRSGVYWVEIRDRCGNLQRDSIYITAKRSDVVRIDTAICGGQSIVIGGQTYSRSGTYTQNLVNTEGCDSTVNISIRDASGLKLTTTNSTCYGRGDGSIRVAGNATGFTLLVNGQQKAFNFLDRMLEGTYRIQLLSAGGCGIDTTVILTEPPYNRITIGRDTIHIPFGKNASLTARPIGNYVPIRWEWTPPQAVSCYTCPTVQTDLTYSTLLTVTAEDAKGCITSASIDVFIDKKDGLYIPNAFNPDREGYTVFGTEYVRIIHSMRIYDRWGELVFEAKDFKPDGTVTWDGSFRGKQMNTGAFVVSIDVEFRTGERKMISSDLLLAR
jgi:CHU_C Type IX secretion signal domain